ncbi:MAG: class I SAM-dependent methyltransferase [Thermoplasmata archaeon]|nr:class I SAM-dependent methyltransferase [Thermoplasmata archaeon]
MGHGLHPAVQGFDRSAEKYERGRPGYPEEALDHLRAALHLRPADPVLELGAGTGKFTRALRPWSVRRIALEPVEGMRAVFRRTSDGAELLAGRAESLPFRDATMAAVVAAQSFHWFRQPETLREIHRVLRPSGALGLVWNRRDERVPWVARLGALIDSEVGEIPRTRSESWRGAFDAVPGFGPIATRVFEHVDRLTPAGVIDRVLSISAIGLLSDDRQRTLSGQVRAILEEDPAAVTDGLVGFPYRTEVYVTPKIDRGRSERP